MGGKTMKIEEIEKLEEAARKYSGVDKIRLAFWEGGKWQFSQSRWIPTDEQIKQAEEDFYCSPEASSLKEPECNTSHWMSGLKWYQEQGATECTCKSENYGYGFAKCFDCGKIKNVKL